MDYYFKNQAYFTKRKKDDAMMRQFKKAFSLFLAILFSVMVFAQEKDVSVADTMRSNGRIYVVVAVLLIILTGLILYVFRLDRKITKLEKEGN